MHPKKQFAIIYCLLVGALLIFLFIQGFQWVWTPPKSPGVIAYETLKKYYCKYGKDYRSHIREINKEIIRKTDRRSWGYNEKTLDRWELHNLPCNCE